MRLGFVLERPFMRYYSLITGTVLAVTFLSSLLGLLGVLHFQTAAASLFVLGLTLLMGQIVLVVTRSDKKNTLGWIVGRFAYMTLFVTSLSLMLILAGMLITSLQLVGGSSSTVMSVLSAIATTTVMCFGVCLSAVSYHALRESES